METLAESGVISHGHFPVSNYYPKTATSPYYTNSGVSISPRPYNNYSGYKSGSEGDISLNGQPGALSPHQYKYSKEVDQDVLKLHGSANLLPSYYHYNMNQLSSSHAPHFKRNFPKEINGRKSDKDLLEDNFPRRKQKNNDNDGEGKDVIHSPQPVYVNNRQEEDRLYSVGKEMSGFSNRHNKFMLAGHMYKSQHSSAGSYPSDYNLHPGWSVSSGDIYRFHKEGKLSSDDQSKDISSIKSEDNMTYGRLESQVQIEGPGSNLRQVTNPESPYNGPYLKQNKSSMDQRIPDLKVDSHFNQTNFASYEEQPVNKEKERSAHQIMLNKDPDHNTEMVKNEGYCSKLFARHDSLSGTSESKSIMSPIPYTRDAKSNQWLDRLPLHPSQEFHESLRSPIKAVPNYPYSSTPGKNILSEEVTCRDQWKNSRGEAFPSSKSNMLNNRHDIVDDGDDALISKVPNTSLPSDHKDEDSQSPSPIKSALTSNARHLYNIVDSPNHCLSRKSVEQESLCDPKESISCNDDSLLSKKEVLSDDGCEDSPYPGTRSHSSLSPPSPDSSMTYPPHFPHPYFASPVRSHPSVQRLQFGSPRGQHEGPQGQSPNFPYDKNYPGQFHLPELNPEMALGGPYIGPLPPNIAQNVEKDLYFCHLCSYSGKSKTEFDTHMNIHFEFNCPHCDYTSRTEGRLKRHIKDFHSDDSSRRALPGRPKVYKCKQCSFSAKEKDKFWEHARTHIKEDKLLQCPKCAFVTEYKHHLEYHLRNHFNSKPYKCNKCNYSCVNKSMLNSHMKSHTNVYQYRCSNCTYATKYCHSLKLHLRKYGHKPATVLNQDGSIPLGLDVESSGIAVVTKRGPPRGPRGPRKEKRGPYTNQMFNMPQGQMGMNPMLNGMMPYWPVLNHMGNMPSHLSPRAGMLPGIGNFSHPVRRSSDGDGCRSLSDSDKMDIIDNSSDDEMGQLRDDEFACRLCSFVGENTESLCIHFVHIHKDEARDVARACGVSEENLAASLSRQIPEMMAGMRRMSEPLTESDSEPSDYAPAKSGTEKSPDCTIVSTEGRNPGSNLYSPGWPSSYPENREAQSYTQVSGNDKPKDNSGEMDILQQMTLKFGSGSFLPHQPLIVSEEEHIQKETPLDLTKPKSLSPKEMTSPLSDTDQGPASVTSPQGNQPFRKRVIQEEVEEEHGADLMTPIPRKRSRKGKAYKLDTLCMKLQVRQINPVEDSEESQSDPDVNLDKFQPLHPAAENEVLSLEGCEEKIEGKAREMTRSDIKVSRGCLPSTSSKSDDEDTDEYEMDDDDHDERKDSFEKNEEGKMAGTEDKAADKNTSNELDSEFEKLQRSLAILNNGIDPDLDGQKSDLLSPSQKLVTMVTDPKCAPPEGADEIDVAGQMELVCQKENILTIQTAEDEQRGTNVLNSEKSDHEDEIKNTSSNFFVPDVDDNLDSKKDVENIITPMNPVEAVCSSQTASSSEQDSKHHTEFDKVNNADALDAVIQNDEPDKHSLPHDVEASQQTEVHKVNLSQESTTENQKTEDSDGSKEKIPEAAQEETIDPVEMINTVIENRKKPVPPAVRRGTELAWKLLHDPVNPVTSLPLPIDSPPLPHSQVTAPTAPSSSTMIANRFPLARNNMRHFMPRAYPSQRPVPPMNTHMHLPLPPTPMAFIPPTSHMMPEPPPLVRPMVPPPPVKLVKPEEYSCNYCGLSFQDCVMYTVHMGYHSNRNPFKCNSCGIVCRDKVDFFLHIARSPHA